MSLLLSVAIVTRHRVESLERTLISLTNQNRQPFEILISDDSHDDKCIAENKNLASKFRCRYLKGPGKGLYANRNFVAKSCKGTHIRTMDDDHTFPDNHIQTCFEAIESNPNVIWVIGEYYDVNNSIPANNQWKVDSTGDTSNLPLSIPGQMHPRGFSYAPKNMKHYHGISCGSTIYPKKVIQDNVLYSEAYKFGILYLEYGARLKSRGYSIRHLSTTYIIHHCETNDASISNAEISKGSSVFSMLMYSFVYNRSAKNIVLTSYEILKQIMFNNYSIKLVFEAYRNYKRESLTNKESVRYTSGFH